MRNEILIISDALVEPPTDSFAFRSITMISHEDLGLSVLLHTTQEMKDLFYRWMKPRGFMDYIDYILTEREREVGIRLDTHIIVGYSPCILTSAICFENQLRLLGSIKTAAHK